MVGSFDWDVLGLVEYRLRVEGIWRVNDGVGRILDPMPAGELMGSATEQGAMARQGDVGEGFLRMLDWELLNFRYVAEHDRPAPGNAADRRKRSRLREGTGKVEPVIKEAMLAVISR